MLGAGGDHPRKVQLLAQLLQHSDIRHIHPFLIDGLKEEVFSLRGFPTLLRQQDQPMALQQAQHWVTYSPWMAPTLCLSECVRLPRPVCSPQGTEAFCGAIKGLRSVHHQGRKACDDTPAGCWAMSASWQNEPHPAVLIPSAP